MHVDYQRQLCLAGKYGYFLLWFLFGGKFGRPPFFFERRYFFLRQKSGLPSRDCAYGFIQIHSIHRRRTLSVFTKNGGTQYLLGVERNFDSLHSFKQHDYVAEFFKNKQQQELIKKSGVRLSVGFDGHIAKEYKPERVKSACRLIQNIGIHLVFEHR